MTCKLDFDYASRSCIKFDFVEELSINECSKNYQVYKFKSIIKQVLFQWQNLAPDYYSTQLEEMLCTLV